MSSHTISKAERIRLYLREYYYRPRLWIRIVRALGGPLLVLTSSYMLQSPRKFSVAYGGFLLVYGTYYLLKPWLLIAPRNKFFRPIACDIIIREDNITTREEGMESTVQMAYIENIALSGGYYRLTTKSHKSLVLSATHLTAQERLVLNQHLTC